MNPILLAALAAVLALVVANEMTSTAPPDAAPAAQMRAASAGKAAPVPATDRTPVWTETILARPLFSSDRRPARRPGGGPAATSASGPTLPRLAGIIMQPGGGLAIFAPAVAGQKPLAVAEGGKLSAWTVLHIAPREVRVSGPGGESTLRVAFDLSPPTPAAPLSGAPNLLPVLRNRPINLHPNQQRQGPDAE